jgi:hypothetical protein
MKAVVTCITSAYNDVIYVELYYGIYKPADQSNIKHKDFMVMIDKPC